MTPIVLVTDDVDTTCKFVAIMVANDLAPTDAAGVLIIPRIIINNKENQP